MSFNFNGIRRNGKFNQLLFKIFSEAKETRRRLLWRLFLTLLEANPDIFGRNRREFVYDCGDTLFCARDLDFPIGETRDFVVNVDRVGFLDIIGFHWENV